MNRSKKAIKTARCRLIHLKNKRKTIAMHLRNDLAEIILNGHEEVAINRVCIFYNLHLLFFIINLYIHTCICWCSFSFFLEGCLISLVA